MKTSPTNLKIRHVITQIKEGKLVPRPYFQRRLVWTSEDKVRFIDTILKGYPFPEIYLANGDVNVDTGEGTQLLVDGQQRVTTISAYFSGDPTTSGASLQPYATLSKEDKEDFLNYDVAARDLGTVSDEELIEVFKRINSTKYSLNEIEVNNAVFTGELMRLASGFAEHEFFDNHKVFRSSDIKRMGDVRFILQVIITMVAGYFNRDELFEEFLMMFNETFPERDELTQRLLKVFSYIDECGFSPKSRIWKKSDLFTVLVQFDILSTKGQLPSPSETLDRLECFYSQVDSDSVESARPSVNLYAKAAIQASNDRLNRVRRGVIIEATLLTLDPEEALLNWNLL